MRPPAFQLYADDLIAGTINLSDAELGFYIRLLCAQWSRGGLPNDDDELMAYSKGGLVQPSLNRVKAKFRVCEDGLLRNTRLELERTKQMAYRERQSAHGKRSVEARLNQPSANPQPTHQPKANSPSPSPSPIAEREYAERPGLDEVLTEASRLGLSAWKAEDWYNEMKGCGWLDHNQRPVNHWQSILARVRTKWEADGRPMSPPTNHAKHSATPTGGVDRNKGTFNEGKSHHYANIGRVKV